MQVFLTLSSDQPAVAAEARAAEEAGYDGLAAGEHLFFHSPHPNAFVSLAAAAGATTRIRLLSSLTVLPLYPAALAAKLATTLDQVSGGASTWGSAWAASTRRVRRGRRRRGPARRTDRRGPGTAPPAVARRAGGLRRPLHPGARPGALPRVPCNRAARPWAGWPRARPSVRAGRFADVWMPYMYTPDQLAPSLGQVRDAAEQAGRDPAVSVVRSSAGAGSTRRARARREVVDGVSAVYQQDFEPLADRYLLHGDPDRVPPGPASTPMPAPTPWSSPPSARLPSARAGPALHRGRRPPAARSPMTGTGQHSGGGQPIRKAGYPACGLLLALLPVGAHAADVGQHASRLARRRWTRGTRSSSSR